MLQTSRSLTLVLSLILIAALASGCSSGGDNQSSMSSPTEPGGGAAGALPACTINFDGSCPDAGSQCGASFSGGNSCRVAGLAFCYDTGDAAYEVTEDSPVMIDLEGDLNSLEVFFAAGGTGQGQMVFRDANGGQVDVLDSNGDCLQAMPARQRLEFARPVRSIEVTSTGTSSWIDTFGVNR